MEGVSPALSVSLCEAASTMIRLTVDLYFCSTYDVRPVELILAHGVAF